MACFDEISDKAIQPPRWRKKAGTLVAAFIATFVGWEETR
jgi:hypothetical protein